MGVTMDTLRSVSKVFKEAKQITIDDSSRIVLMSDCHRGDGSWADDFSRNQNLFFAALRHYYQSGYTYIELGDGDELWENRRLSTIINTHDDAFWLLSRFYKEGRLYFIFGNHDMVKKSDKFVKNNLYQYFDERTKKYMPLFEGAKIHEGLVLKYKGSDKKILLLHGHQVDFFNSKLWRLSRFLVRFLWRPLNLIGVNDPTRAAKNYTKKEEVAQKLTEWAKREKCMVVAGHNHRPSFPEAGEPPYFNDGSCVHPRCITAIEISEGHIWLVKWNVETKSDGALSIGRKVLAGPRRLEDCFKF